VEWFFAIVIVLVIGVVAVVASGRGAAMAEVYDDRPDARVQADGPLTPRDLRTVRFTTAFRGYRMSEVDALLDRLSAELRQSDTERDAERDAEPDAKPAAAPDAQPDVETPSERGR